MDNKVMGKSLSLGRELPLVSIGMPIFNEERFVEASIASICNQNYPNMEIIISDNASTDGTAVICEKFAVNDERIKYLCKKNNEGAMANFISVLRESKGEYFMWASGHDLWSEGFISEAVELFQANDSAAIVCPRSEWIDSEGQVLEKVFGGSDTRGMDSVARFFTVFFGNMNPILGLIRKSYLDEIKTIHSCVGSDLLLLEELSLKGDFIHANEASWSRREFRGQESYAEKLRRYKSVNYKLAVSRINRYFPLLRLPMEIMSIVLRSNISVLEKILITFSLMPLFALRYISGKRAHK